MAFHWHTFKTRALTAIVFVVLMMVGLLWSEWSFFILFSVVHFGAWTEYQKLIKLLNKDYAAIGSFHRYGVMIAGWCLLLYFTNGELHFFGYRLSTIGLWLGLILMILIPVVVVIKTEPGFIKNLLFSFLGLLYLSLPLALFIDLRTHWAEEKYSLNLVIPLLIIFTIWINDTMAYI